ncbi:sulfurtransferase, partial [Fulvivirga lutimaris]|uniref:sulfurtransferase n=1 Tax=Fulvivirga lutimaris TaxID=1819566 RepID=UPI0016262E3A
MNWKIKLVVLALIFSACQNTQVDDKATAITEDKSVKSDYLIEVRDFKKLVDHPNIKILDLSKKDIYDKEHIVGARHIRRLDIEDSTFSYGGMMAPAEQIESLFSNLGINTNDTIIIYDDKGLCEAARLWWILQNYDFTKVKLLHGGLPAWKAGEGKVTTDIPVNKKSEFKLPNSQATKYYTSQEEVQTAFFSGAVILDVRSTDEYTGKTLKTGALKSGRIPGSKNI